MHPCGAVCRGAGAGRSRGRPHGRDHRQPERPGRRKRGAQIDPSGFDANKKIKGKKRHLVVDTLGLALSVAIQPASVQDHDGAVPVLAELKARFPSLSVVWADSAYAGPKLAPQFAALGPWQLVIARKQPGKGFVVLAKTMDHRANFRLARTLSPPRQGLREPRPQSSHLRPSRDDQAHAPSPDKSLIMTQFFPDG